MINKSVFFYVFLTISLNTNCQSWGKFWDPSSSITYPPGQLDTSFDPGVGADNGVYAVAVQTDGKILIGGDFINYGGLSRSRIARLNTDGSLDTSFTPGTGFDGTVLAISIQPDGKIFAAGNFTTYNGAGRNYVVRINADGSLDGAFSPGTGASSTIQTLVLQSDGKIVIAGDFVTFGGTGRNRIARVNSDGTLDAAFNPGTGIGLTVFALAMQSDGKILLGGNFTTYNGTARNRIARVDTSGTLDVSFDPGTGMDNSVYSIGVQTDGKIIAGGDFITFNGGSQIRLARLNADGTLDLSASIGSGANALIRNLLISSSAKILIGGSFSTYNGVGRNRIARLENSGAIDTIFDPGTGANSTVYSVVAQSDGKLIIAGNFTSYNGILRNRVARLH